MVKGPKVHRVEEVEDVAHNATAQNDVHRPAILMKLTSATCYQVIVPAHPGAVNSAPYGPAVFDETSKFIIEAQTDEGHIGLGETPRGITENSVRSALRLLKDTTLDRICLQDPPIVDFSADDLFAHEHPNRPHRMREQLFGSSADNGIHALLLDLLGKKCGVPLYMLLGGPYRDRIRADYWMGRMTPEDSAVHCLRAKELGYRGVKCKCALEDDNIERAQAVRDACGTEFKMTFDPNGRFYRYGQSIGMLCKLASVGNIGCVEDPYPGTHLDEFRLLRSHGLFPVALHTSYNANLLDAIRQNAVDYINVGDTPWRVLQAAGICWLANVPTWHGSGVDLGILESMVLHICAAGRSITLPCDVFGRMIRRHNLITNPLAVIDGTIAVPSGNGLGVELDRDALDQYTVRKFMIDFI